VRVNGVCHAPGGASRLVPGNANGRIRLRMGVHEMCMVSIVVVVVVDGLCVGHAAERRWGRKGRASHGLRRDDLVLWSHTVQIRKVKKRTGRKYGVATGSSVQEFG